MNKTSIKKALMRSAAGAEFVNRGHIKRCMGWGNDRTGQTVKGLDYIVLGRTRQYDVDEVAARIYEQVEVRRNIDDTKYNRGYQATNIQ